MIWRALELFILWLTISCTFVAAWIFVREIVYWISSRRARDEHRAAPMRSDRSGVAR